MGKDKQTAKKRTTDKYYRLAKEQGFRSRAAFKLIQLNKKYEFLSSAKVCLDLCAAPGGWLQVASKNMPASSIIVGVDLAPIKAISNCITLTEDITTQKCRDAIKKHFGTWKADVVLHDGAPNVGTAWVQDAFGQAELTLSALKLAVEFLRPGGTFVTKVFRSKDYNSLLWVFNQLFKSVEATKPQASRNESAEIFVVCRHFVAAKYIDPKLLDPRHVFKDLDQPVQQTDIFQKSKQKRHREGYADDAGPLLFKKISAVDFIEGDHPIQLLGEYNQIFFDKEAETLGYTNHPQTNAEVKYCCDDLKVLNKKDFKAILKWRMALRELPKCKERVKERKERLRAEGVEVSDDEESEKEEEEEAPKPLTEAEEDALEEEELDQKVTQLSEREKRALKLEKKKKQKRIMRANLKMNIDASDMIQTPKDAGLFNIGKEKVQLEDGEQAPDEAIEGSESEMDPESESDDDDLEYSALVEKYLDRQYNNYLEKKKTPVMKAESIGKKKKKRDVELPAEEDFQGISTIAKLPDGFRPNVNATVEEILAGDSQDEESSDNSDDEEDNEEGVAQSVIEIKEEEESVKESKRTAMWFNQSLFDDILGDTKTLVPIKVEPGLEEETKNEKSKKREKPIKEEEPSKKKKKTANDIHEQFPDDGTKPVIQVPKSKVAAAGENDDFEVAEEGEDSDSDYDSEELTETLALGTYAVRSRKFSQLIDDSYNRYAFNDDELPQWFVDDENRHNKPQLPVTKAMVQEIKERFKAIDARPMKKVVEAKARKKMRTMKKLVKAKAQANSIALNTELSAGEKMRQIEKLFKGQMKRVKPESVYVVSKKHTKAKRIKGKKVKVVDPRMKKERRAEKRIAKKLGKRPGGGVQKKTKK